MFKIINNDCIAGMATFSDNHFHSCITDPPYGLKFMGAHWDHGVPDKTYWQEVWRVLRPGGYLLAFGGTRTFHRLMVEIEDAGFEIRDTIMWVYGSGFPKGNNIGKSTGLTEFQGWNTNLKPAWEPIIVARKPVEGTVAENAMKYGTGGINIDGCRVNGRYPANLIHDGEVYFSNEAARFFYCAKASVKDRNEGCEIFEPQIGPKQFNENMEGKIRSNGTVIKEAIKHHNNHPTVKPTNLMQYLCKLVTPKNGIILDPFCGSGSTGKAALLEGFNFVGIEKEEHFANIAELRCKHVEDRTNPSENCL